jgi:hypothetical protein
MKTLNEYLQESLLDDFDDLEKSMDDAVYEPQLKEMMCFLMPSYVGNFRTEWDKCYNKKTKVFAPNISHQSLYLISINNRIYALPIDNTFRSVHGDELKDKLKEYINLINEIGIIFEFHDDFYKVYVHEDIINTKGKIHNKVKFKTGTRIIDLYLPLLTNEWIKVLNDCFGGKLKKVFHLYYKVGVVIDLQKDLNEIKFPFELSTIHLNLPISINGKVKPWKTGNGLINNDNAYHLIKDFMEKYNMTKMDIHKPGSVFINGEIVCHYGSLWFNKW